MLSIDFGNPVIASDMDEIHRNLKDAARFDGCRIAMIGATGMIASYVVAYLTYLKIVMSQSIEIVAVGRSREKLRERFGAFAEQGAVKTIVADAVRDDPEKYLEGHEADFLIHGASLASPQYYGAHPVETLTPNVVGSWRCLEYARRHGIVGYEFLSSDTVYGKAQPTGDSISEADVGNLDYLAAGSEYAEGKRVGEALGMAYAREYDVPATAIRITHTYGPTIDIEGDRRVFAAFVSAIVEARALEMTSDGSALRSFSYITDTVTAILTVLAKGVPGTCYNIANDDAFISILELAKRLETHFADRGLSVTFRRQTHAGYQRDSHERFFPLDTSRLRSLGWQPRVGIEEGFERTVRAIEWDR